jgi:hypothetical protein
MKKKTGYITKIVNQKERIAFYGSGSFVVTQVTKGKAQREAKTINKRYGKGTAYYRKTSTGDKNNMWLPIWSVFLKR